MADDREFHSNLVDQNGLAHPTGKPVNDRDQAFAVVKRRETRKEYLGKGCCFVSLVDDAGIEIHREGVDAEKNG
jgi:hypothetical protein